jgi:hypothetical protein
MTLLLWLETCFDQKSSHRFHGALFSLLSRVRTVKNGSNFVQVYPHTGTPALTQISTKRNEQSLDVSPRNV